MNKLVVLCEGAADKPTPQFRDRTPLEVARCPAANQIAAEGRSGFLGRRGTPADAWPRSLLYELLGLDAEVRRGPCEWLALGEPADGATFVYHASLLTCAGETVLDHAPSMTYGETEHLAKALQEAFEEDIQIRTLGAGQLLFAFPWAPRSMPELLALPFTRGRRIVDLLAGVKETRVSGAIRRAAEVLETHPVNEVRVDLRENPANGIWLWGGGWSREPPPERGGSPAGFVMAGAPWARGAAQLAGWEVVGLQPLATMEGEGPAFELAPTVAQFHRGKNCLVYVDSPNILGNFGDPSSKVRRLDLMDFYLIRHLRTLMDARRPMRISLVADGAVRSETGLPVDGTLPVTHVGDGVEPDDVDRFNERSCVRGGLGEIARSTLRSLLWNENM